MKLKRILSGVIGLPIVVLILIFGNTYVIDAIFGIVAIFAMYEYLKAFSKDAKPLRLISYLACLIIPFLHIIREEYLGFALAVAISCLMAFLFIRVILSNMKIKLMDIMITFFGIAYIVFFLSFLPLLHGAQIGKYLIWYIFIAAWGTDTCAYFVGSKYGKHKLTQISPKKTIEGCIRRNNWCSYNCYNIYNMYKQICKSKYFIYLYRISNLYIKYIKPNRRFGSVKHKKNGRYKRFWKFNSRTRWNIR